MMRPFVKQLLSTALDKAAEILSSVCQVARDRKTSAQQPGLKSLTPAPDVPAPLSTTSTLRATVTGLYTYSL